MRYRCKSAFLEYCVRAAGLGFIVAMTSSIVVAQSSNGGQLPATNTTPSDSGELTEIVVQAQRRSENVQNVPIAVTVVTEAEAAARGIDDIQSLAISTPSLSTTHGSAAPNIYLRGIGNTSISAGQEQDVAVYVDGVYYPQTYADVFSFNNIDHIEVLKGPQGTLFGRNAVGGVIQVITRDPSDSFSGNANVGYGNFNTVSSNAYVTGPVSQSLAADLAVQFDRQYDGWGRNVFDGSQANLGQDANVRSKWVWKPTDSTKVTASGSYFYTNSDIGESLQQLPNVPQLPPPYGSAKFDGNIYDSNAALPTFAKIHQYTGSVRIDQQTSLFDLASISAYTENGGQTDLDLFPGPIEDILLSQRNRSISEELQILSPAQSRIKWVGGLFFFHADSALTPLEVGVGPTLLPVFTLSDQEVTKSYAAYGQATVPVFDHTNLTLGARYTRDYRSLDGLLAGAPPFAFSKQWSDPTYRAGLDHHFTEDHMGYVSVSTGFKSGLFNANNPFQPAVDPEKLTDYEAGLKSEYLEHRLEVNTGAFYYRYKDIQLVKIVDDNTVLQNAAAAKAYGLEIETQAKVTSAFELRGGLSVMHSEYTSFPGAAAAIPTPSGINIPVSVDATGKQMLRTPNATLDLGMDYAEYFGFGKIKQSLTCYYNSGFPWEADNRLRQRAYSLVNASSTFTDLSNRYEVQLWAKNLFNQPYYNIESSAAGGPDVGGAAPPRTYGITFGIRF